jgi:hypothetical protein
MKVLMFGDWVLGRFAFGCWVLDILRLLDFLEMLRILALIRVGNAHELFCAI